MTMRIHSTRRAKLNVEMTDSYLPEIFDLLRKTMKAHGVGYRELAKTLQIYESGLKKIFRARDCSINRLTRIASALGLSLTEIFAELDSPSPSRLEFDPAVDRFLAENFDYFQFYWRLFYERMSIDVIQKTDGISEKEVFKILRKLDQFKLIELHENNRIKLPRAEFGYFRSGLLLKKMRSEWTRTIFEDAQNERFDGKRFFTFYYLKLSEASLQRLTHSLQALIQEYTRETLRNAHLKQKGTENYRLLFSLASGSFVKTRSR